MTTRLLTDHGTKLIQLKAANLLQAIAADLKLRQAKREDVFDKNGIRFAQYVFHRRHVVDAGDALEVLLNALRDRAAGLASGKTITRVVYGDIALLRETYVAAGGGTD